MLLKSKSSQGKTHKRKRTQKSFWRIKTRKAKTWLKLWKRMNIQKSKSGNSNSNLHLYSFSQRRAEQNQKWERLREKERKQGTISIWANCTMGIWVENKKWKKKGKKREKREAKTKSNNALVKRMGLERKGGWGIWTHLEPENPNQNKQCRIGKRKRRNDGGKRNLMQS